ncbi:MAG TPA: PDZ domain-containing protein [Gemmatimonadales bacterium]
MNRKWLLIASAVALVLPAALAAQETPAPRARRAPRAESRAFSFTFADNRGRIGVVVNTAKNTETDRYGAKIDAITPGGPAEKAGIKAGDIITKFNGTSLAGVSAEDRDDSGPGMRLIELAHQLEPGDTVRVEYRRGSDTKSATLVAADLGDRAWTGVMPRMAVPSPRFEMGDLGPMALLGEGNSFAFCFGDSWCDLDLVTLNADLGEYFGTREGLLVVKAPADSALPLKSGDVILSIGGRKPTSPAHAMRILRSYDTGEAVSIEILRHQRRQTLSWTVPEESERSWYRTPQGRSRERGMPSVWKIQPGSRMKLRVSAI